VNKDGYLDLLVANSGSNTVSVLTGNSNGTFNAQVTYTVGTSPWSLTTGDVNGDNKLDLLVANSGSNTVSILLNDSGTRVFTEGSAPVVIKSGISVSDPDNTTLASSTVSIGSGFQSSEDVLAFTNNGTTMGNIVGVYNQPTGILSLTSANASATVAQWQAALASVTYANTSDSPNTAERVIAFVVNDGVASSAIATQTVTVTGVNDVPVVAITDVTGAVTEMLTPIGNLTDSGTISFSDADLTDTHSVSSVTASAGALGTLTPTITTDTTGSGVGGVVTWNYSVAASAITYLAERERKVETFRFGVLDNHGGGVERTVSVTINGKSDDTLAPTLTSSTPADNATVVSVGSNIVLTFSEAVQAGIGNIVLSNGRDIRTISVTDSQIAITGNTVTINPANDLQASSTYYLQMARGVIKDLAGNAYSGMDYYTSLDFTTKHAPIVMSSSDTTLSFADKATYAAGLQPVSVTTCDLNGDTKLDLFVANSGSGSPHILVKPLFFNTPSGYTHIEFATVK
jgi:VCBS repeat-containing protein